MSLVKLSVDDVNKIKKTTLVREYQSETEGFKGKKYNIYAFREKAFTVHQDDQFQVDLAAGVVFECELDDTEDGLSLLNYTTVPQAINAARTKALVKFYNSDNYKPELNYSELA